VEKDIVRLSVKKGQIYEGVVESVEFPNKSKVTVEGEVKPVILKNGIPGQKVKFYIKKVRKGKAEGVILEVLENSPMEIDAACLHFGFCGGCTYQNLPYEEQLKLKESQLKSLLDTVLDEGYQFEGVKGSPNPFAYRNKMEFSFGDEYKDGPLALGMHKRGSFYDIVNVSECQIVDEDFRKVLVCTHEYFTKIGMPYYHRMKRAGYLRHLLVRKGIKTGEILINLVTTRQNNVDKKEWVNKLLGLPLSGRIVGILHTYNDSVADVVKDEGTDILYGQNHFYEELLGLKFKITPFSFFQTNSLGAEVLYEAVREYIGNIDGQVVFDLYSGTGTIAQILASVAKQVVGVEIVEEAVEAAKVNAECNGLDNCEFIAGDVLKVVDELENKPDVIVLDPPRDGVHPKALNKIIRFGVQRIVYVSCKPTSLMRDLESILAAGYQVKKVGGIDQFPGTYHMEVICLLELESS